jgi:hypothetical protein
MRGRGHFLHGAMERLFVGPRRVMGSAQLSDELKRRRANLIVSRGRVEIGERPDIPTHLKLLNPSADQRASTVSVAT